ncbi:hypothetical protein P692DRAFT_20338367 [Suillus brevipes Sb2]|nr:hypothetical protein P692DRAFT_20338367 [Suillus brevipes Sb2]
MPVKSLDRDFCVLKTPQASDDKHFYSNTPFQLPAQDPKTVLNPDQLETTFKHPDKDLTPITKGRETLASPGFISMMFDNHIGSFTASASRSARRFSTTSTTNVPFEAAHHFASQGPSFTGRRGLDRLTN